MCKAQALSLSPPAVSSSTLNLGDEADEPENQKKLVLNQANKPTLTAFQSHRVVKRESSHAVQVALHATKASGTRSPLLSPHVTLHVFSPYIF